MMDDDWDILYLGKCIDKCESYEHISDDLYRSYYPFCTHAYVIRKKAIEKLLTEKIYAGNDYQLVKAIENKNIKAYVFHPSIFQQDIVRWKSDLRTFEKQTSNTHECKNYKSITTKDLMNAVKEKLL
jgi:hypothetical protein